MSGSGRKKYLVQQLSILPREIVDKIFDNLSLFKALQLATWADPVITAYIVEHDQYGKVFLSAAQLCTAAFRFQIWCQVKTASGWRNDWHLFAINPTSSLFGGVTYNAVMDDMMADIKQAYLDACVYSQILSQFSAQPISPDISEKCLGQHLQRLWTAQENIKELESQQLNILADFLETYPHMLRWAHDPRGDASTTRPEHMIKKLRVYAKKVFNTQYMRIRKPVHCMSAFRNGILPLVPRDWCLQLLLRADLPMEVLDSETSQRTSVGEMTDTLQHTSLAVPNRQVQGVLEKVQHLKNDRPTMTERENALPFHVTHDLRTVFRGLIHRYARPDHKIDGTPIARIFATDYIKDIQCLFSRSFAERRQILRQDPPSFLVPLRSEFRLRAEAIAMKHHRMWINEMVEEEQFMSVLPYHEQELEWLRAFLRSVAYLQTLEAPGKELQQ